MIWIIATDVLKDSALPLIVSAICGIVGWFLRAWKDREEIRKLKFEVIVLQGTHLKNVQEARDKYNAAARKFKGTVAKFTDALRNKEAIDQIDNLREILCEDFTGDVLQAFLVHHEWQVQDKQNEPVELKSYIDDSLVPELERLAYWRTVFNRQNLLDALPNKNPLIISKRHLTDFRKAARYLPQVEKTDYYKKIDTATSRLTQV